MANQNQYSTGQSQENDAKEPLWYVLIHLNPKWIQTILERESRGELLTQEEQKNRAFKEPFAFYVPYLDLRTDANLQLRSDFHSFVFIRASDDRLRTLLASDWNRQTRLPLYCYRNRDGSEIKITESEVNALKSVFHKANYARFQGIPPLTFEDVKQKTNCSVRVHRPGWENLTGIAVQIRAHKTDQTVTMRVAFMFQTIKRVITFENLTIDEVTFDDGRQADLLTGKVLENFEQEVALLLGHRFVHKKIAGDAFKRCSSSTIETQILREDAPRLRRMLSFSDIMFDDEDERRRFTALMLMCAKLLNDEPLTAHYQSQVEQWISDEITTPTEAYLAISLFVATQNATLRTAIKTYRNTHPDCPPIISRLYNKVRDMETKKEARMMKE